MNYGLNSIEKMLHDAYTQHLSLQLALEQNLPHTAGGLRLFKSRKKGAPPDYYYIFRQGNQRCSKRIHPEDLKACQDEIQTLKEREQALKYTKEELAKIEKCMKAIHFDLDAYEKQQRTTIYTATQNTNVPFPENLRHNTLAGIKVRSKSEALLVNLFFSYNVHFEYEKEIKLGNTTFYPDFTITAPDERIFYWEHLGMLEDPTYARNWARKHDLYMRNGISEGNGLIITRDTNGVFDAADALYKIKLHNLSHIPQ